MFCDIRVSRIKVIVCLAFASSLYAVRFENRIIAVLTRSERISSLYFLHFLFKKQLIYIFLHLYIFFAVLNSYHETKLLLVNIYKYATIFLTFFIIGTLNLYTIRYNNRCMVFLHINSTTQQQEKTIITTTIENGIRKLLS